MTNATTSRRQFLTTALGVTAAAAVAGGIRRGAPAQSAAPNALGEVMLRDDLTLVTGLSTNVVVLRTAGSAAVVDSGPPSHAAELAKLVLGRMGLLPVELLFNTHWHLAHTGGND